MSNSLQPHGPWPTRLLCPWDSPGKNTGVGCHFLLQGIFPTQGSNPGSSAGALEADALTSEPPGKPVLKWNNMNICSPIELQREKKKNCKAYAGESNRNKGSVFSSLWKTLVNSNCLQDSVHLLETDSSENELTEVSLKGFQKIKSGFPCDLVVKNLPANAEDAGSIPGWEDPLEKKWQPTPVFLPGKSYGQRGLVGYVHGVARSQRGPKRLKHTQTYKIKPRLEICILPSFSF